MATISSRLTNTGNLLVNGSFNEVTFNTTSPTINNLIINSQNHANVTSWPNVNVTAYGNTTSVLAPDGTQTATRLADSGTAFHYITQSVVVPVAGVYTHSVHVRAGEVANIGVYHNSGSWGAKYNVSTGTLIQNDSGITSSITSLGNGWYRIAASYTYASSGTYGVRLYLMNPGTNYTVSTSGNIYVWGSQFESGNLATVYQPIASANTVISSGASKHTIDTIYASGGFDEVTYSLRTPTIKNLVTYSQQFSNVAWVNTMTVNSTTAIAPDNSTTAAQYTSTGSGLQYVYQSIAVTPSTTYTLSFSAKLGTLLNSEYLLAVYNETGASFIAADVAPGITLSSSDWNRVSYTFATPAGCTSVRVYPFRSNSLGASLRSLFLWGVQLELGSSATIYQAITTSNTLVSSSTARKIDKNGGYYIQGEYDEFTGAPVVDGNVVLWIDPGQTSSYAGSGTTVTDLSTSANNLTLVGSPTYNATTGGGTFAFNGSSQYGYVPYSASLAPTAGITINSWAFLSNWNVATNMRIVSKTEAGGYNIALNDPGTTAGNVSAVFNIGGTYYYAGQFLTSVSSGWHNIAATCDGRYSNLYIDGSIVKSTDKGSAGTINFTSNNNLVWGAEAGGLASNSVTAGGWTGSLGPLMVYNRVLSADEIQQNFTALRQRYGI